MNLHQSRIMVRITPPLLPRMARLLEGLGSQLKLARLRRQYASEMARAACWRVTQNTL
jgi:hypothetical protein